MPDADLELIFPLAPLLTTDHVRQQEMSQVLLQQETHSAMYI